MLHSKKPRERHWRFFKQLVKEYPTNSNYAHLVAKCTLNLATLYHDQQDYKKSESELLRARDLTDEIVRKRPSMIGHKVDQASIYLALGSLYVQTNQEKLASDAYAKAAPICGRLLEDHPSAPSSRVLAGMLWAGQGHLHRLSKNWPSAREYYDKSIKMLEPLKDTEGGKEALGEAYLGNVMLLATMQDFVGALQEQTKALSVLKPGSAEERMIQHTRLMTVAGIYNDSYHTAVKGDHAKAAKFVEVLSAQKDLPGEIIYAMAAVYGICAKGVRTNAKLTSSEREKVFNEYADRAVALLARASRAGFKNESSVSLTFNLDPRAEKSFDSLRDHNGFKKVVGVFGKKTK